MNYALGLRHEEALDGVLWMAWIACTVFNRVAMVGLLVTKALMYH